MSADEDRHGLNTGTDIGVRFTSIRDLTEFSRFHGTPKCTASTLQFSVVLGTRSDFQKAASERDGDCMRSVVRMKFIHQVLDVEVNRVL
jgi:hypothetical protein